MSKILAVLLILGVLFAVIQIFLKLKNSSQNAPKTAKVVNNIPKNLNPLSIEALRNRDYPGSNIIIDQELDPGANYKQYIASCISDGLKIYGLLTVPDDASDKNPVPAIVFDHGYIQPDAYSTTARYVDYVDALAQAGYVVFKIDYRGNGNSEGNPEGAYFSPAYSIDTLNAAESLKKLPYVNKNKIGLWGHSMAGMITTRAMAAKPNEFQAAVIWGGVVGSYQDLQTEWWSKRTPRQFRPTGSELYATRPNRENFIKQYGEPKEGNPFWDSISPTTYIKDFKTPIQLDYGEEDEEVPPSLSKIFYNDLEKAGKMSQIYSYSGADHNISQSFGLAMQRTIEFFDKYLK